jgi:hypothetical protein
VAKRNVLTFRLTDEEKNYLLFICRENKMSLTEVIRNALTNTYGMGWQNLELRKEGNDRLRSSNPEA